MSCVFVPLVSGRAKRAFVKHQPNPGPDSGRAPLERIGLRCELRQERFVNPALRNRVNALARKRGCEVEEKKLVIEKEQLVFEFLRCINLARAVDERELGPVLEP